MTTSRRTLISMIGMAGAAILAAAARARSRDPAPQAAALVAVSERANAALMRGDIATYRSLMTYSDDFTLMSPFGGTPSRAAEYTPERMERMGRFFRNGRFDQELVQSWTTPDMVVLALIERQWVEVGGLPGQDWALRVTLVFRRDAGQWRLAHRHADPLVEDVSLEKAAALARGAR